MHLPSGHPPRLLQLSLSASFQSSPAPLSFLSDETWLGLYGVAVLSCSIICGQVRSKNQDLSPSPELWGHADGRSQPGSGSSLQGEHVPPSCSSRVLAAEQESTIASGGRDAFTRCVSAMSLCSLSHHALESWTGGQRLT